MEQTFEGQNFASVITLAEGQCQRQKGYVQQGREKIKAIVGLHERYRKKKNQSQGTSDKEESSLPYGYQVDDIELWLQLHLILCFLS